jgi:uncharacterized membrane protein required for colicin V production
MADLLLVVLVVLMALWGLKAGFVKAVFHLGYYIISIIAAMLLYPVFSNYLINSRLSFYIQDKIIMPRIAVDAESIKLPSFLRQAVSAGIENTTEAIAASLTEMVLNIICFIAVFLIVKFGLKLVVKVLNTIAKLPVLSLFNKLGGLAVGAFNGIIISYIVLAVATIFINEKIYTVISASKYVSAMYNNNIILKLLFG